MADHLRIDTEQETGASQDRKQLLLRMQELVDILNRAARAYYQEDREIMSNLEYDRLYDELEGLEQELGIVMSKSPTQQVGYEVLSELEKEAHDSPMLSLDKTKSPEALRDWLGSQEGLLSWKMDGLTVVLTYREGRLAKAVTRGNGVVGEVITNNARVFANLPARIPYEGDLVLRGEAVIKYSDFRKINEAIDDVDARYKNPRNLCSGTVRQLNNEITAKRNVYFFAFSMVDPGRNPAAVPPSVEDERLRRPSNSVEENMLWVQSLGFDIVPYQRVSRDNILEAVEAFAKRIPDNDFPSDGLVLIYDDIAYGISLGRTAKFPRNSIAFKWADEEQETRLTGIEWSPSRTGLINPIALFDPVELEGTTVSRASLHNLSIMDSLALGIGDRIKVYKANMIIPQISENLTRSGGYPIPDHCPACGGATEIRMENDVKTLYCSNPFCSAKKVKLFSHFVSRDAMAIDGISEKTLMKMIDQEFLKELDDLYHLGQYKEQIVGMEGFGEKSFTNMMASIDRSRHARLFRFVYALGILNVGLSNARLLCGHFGNDLGRLREASLEEMTQIEGIGGVIAQSVRDYFDNPHNKALVDRLLQLISFEPERTDHTAPAGQGDQPDDRTVQTSLEGKTFVITGAVNHFKNRNELKEKILELGGKATGSVSKKTDYLINNDNSSGSSKNKKARELGIPVITEEEFLRMIGEETK